MAAPGYWLRAAARETFAPENGREEAAVHTETAKASGRKHTGEVGAG
jgi:hypothetical protein